MMGPLHDGGEHHRIDRGGYWRILDIVAPNLVALRICSSLRRV